MKVLIISDSHGLTDVLVEIKKRHINEVEAIIHCGDSELNDGAEQIQDMLIVKGNCDFLGSFPNEIIETIGTYRFFITHGHLYSVKTTLMKLKYRAEEAQANIVCFGHSHIAGAELVDGKLFINPGSIFLPRMRNEKTYAILELMNGQAIVDFYNLHGEKISNLSTKFQFA
ncbi:metallophosphoesterase [Aeribacillus pallidus]|uniref:metallophosphoesterase family protein n=1 Tax=Aeribacillus TaxID=1055323 RepID=UPI0007B4E7C7|nr:MULTISPECIES: metallophosphoesterase [Aeribacillus]KZM52320.1 metallophosphatase [Aeribacillus pallidus]MED0652366.1 metallophosphoesterase [Aeribacillus composti]MED4488781.1 metallophosphoesterase [Aeribacillus pallidus]